MNPSRRLLLQGLGGLVGASLARPARAAATTQERRFIFVVTDGGWDPLTAFAPIFDSDYVQMGSGAEPGRIGGIDFVDHANRPSVRSFFERYGGQAAIINGVSVPSVSHDVCRMLSFTGSSGGERADWPTLLGVSTAPTTLPSLVLSGPSFPGPYGVASARVGSSGQLSSLLDASIYRYTDTPITTLPRGYDTDVDALLDARIGALSGRLGANSTLGAAFTDAHARLKELRSFRNVDLSAIWDQSSRIDLAVQALGAGLSRCVSLTTDGYYGTWDSHTDNEDTQSFGFELLFSGLLDLMEGLANTNDPDGVPLIDTTVIVALSEMGRTPTYNSSDGRDHWPFTSVLLAGAGVAGDQVISRFDEGYYGVGYDPDRGVEDETAPALTPEHIGATLLALAGVDPTDALPAVSPIARLLG